ncbi:MAG: SIMPL domain-containing protein [Oligoflexia bacterium]|nr:SIMPL domain-containing protein [Oligoflexia bacterium]
MQSERGNAGGGLLLGVALAVGLVLSAKIISQALVEIRDANQIVTVKGYAERKIESNFGVWRGSFSQISPNLTAGYEAIKSDLSKVLAHLEGKSIQRDSITVSGVEAVALYKQTEEGTETNQIEAYRLTQTVTVKLPDTAVIDRLSRESTELMQQGIGFTSNPPEYYYTKIDELKIDMLAEAAKDAKTRAERLVESTGDKIGSLRSAQQGVFQITPEYSTTVSDYGENDTNSLRKSIKAVVTMQFAVK